MSAIVMASNNRHKIKEIETFLKKYCPFDEKGEAFSYLSLSDIGFTEEIKEDGATFEENALIKARAVAKLGYIGVADDSGLCVDALHGEPGVYSARYAGGHDGMDDANNAKLLLNMTDVPDEKRTAQFVSAIGCVFPDGTELVARGECPGKILYAYQGSGGFGYDPLFLYEPMGKTFAQMNAEEKNSISHRANAMANFAKLFAAEIESRKG